MRQAGISRILTRVALVVALVLSGGSLALAEDNLDTLGSMALVAYRLGKYTEAAAITEKAVALGERTLGPEHPDTLQNINNLGHIYKKLGRFGEAEPLLKRAITGWEQMFGLNHPDTLSGLNNLAALYNDQGRYSEAEPLYKRVLGRREWSFGPEHPDTLTAVNNLAALYRAQGRYSEAEPLYQRAFLARERTLGPEHPDTLISVNNLSMFYLGVGRYSEAEPLLKRALTVRERVIGPEHPDTLGSIINLAELYRLWGRYSEAEPLQKRGLAGFEKALGLEHPTTLIAVNNLAALYEDQGRYGEAEPLYQRALAVQERTLGPEHPATLAAINNLAAFYRTLRRYSEAETLAKRALAGRERVHGAEHPATIRSVNNLGLLYDEQGRHEEAEPLLRRALAGSERILGPEHPETLISVNNLAGLYYVQGRYGEAQPLMERVVANSERALGLEHPDTLRSITNLAMVYFQQRDWPRAAALWRRGASAVVERTKRGVQATDQAFAAKKKGEEEQSHFLNLVSATYQLAQEDNATRLSAPREMFQMAQWALSSEAAQALAEMAARGAKGDGALAALVRERQDLLVEWQKRELLRNAALGRETATRDGKAEAENDERMAAINAGIADIDKRLAAEFPDYAALASPTPLSTEDVQAEVGADEALILFLSTPDGRRSSGETFIWVVTKTDVRWVRSDLSGTILAREVKSLRCGLDHAAWTEAGCAELTGTHHAQSLPFDHARAHRLYQALFGEVEDLIKGKHLLLVPSGALTQLPFQVLVTVPPAGGDHRSAAWLARGHALSVLPAVSSLRSLRMTGRPSAAKKPLIGFGNPLLDGPDDRYASLAKLAHQKQSCSETPWQSVAAVFGVRMSPSALETRGGLANVSLIRSQVPLPETADELCAVARDIGVDAGEMRLGAKATEREVKAMSAGGALAQYRIVHFATHGAMAGELKGAVEPGLVLTPPDAASEEDDGYLSASEIAALKLDADLVILSACNTAAGNAASAEAFSGLARAFIYAQARALLVSHWAVDSGATVRLITSAMREIARDKTIGRAEAMRRAMLAVIDKGKPHEAHPAYWAPFIVVGEGAH
jgi:CHAT domain-containing protein/tetratricopeptide (TPR) repeat protein